MKSSVVTIILLLLGAHACTVDDQSWQRGLQRHIDTTSNNQIALMKDSLDSLCLQRYEALIEGYADSIKLARVTEIKRLLDK